MSVDNPTPEKLRAAIVPAFHEQGMSYAQIAEFLDVGEATASRVLRLHRETGSVAPRPRGGGNFSPIRGEVADKLSALVAERSEATVEELVTEFAQRVGVKTSRSSVLRALHRLGFTRKSPSSLKRGIAPTSSGAAASWQR